MTEPAVASSDATNISASIVRDGDDYVINGRKWWTSGASDPRCKVLIFMGKTDPQNENRHRQQSMILVPMDAPGVRIVRPVPVFGYLDEPHGHPEVDFENVRVPVSNLLLGEGRGFEIAQGRLGPGRIHHCMRLLGAAERALEAMCRRSLRRSAFHKLLAEQGVWRERIADARMKLDQARLLTLHAAWKMDVAGNKAAQKEIAMIKVVAPNVACQVIDQAIQLFGGAGVTDDFGLGWAYASSRTLRIADGPDEVHRNHIAKLELARYFDALSASWTCKGRIAFVTGAGRGIGRAVCRELLRAGRRGRGRRRPRRRPRAPRPPRNWAASACSATSPTRRRCRRPRRRRSRTTGASTPGLERRVRRDRTRSRRRAVGARTRPGSACGRST